MDVLSFSALGVFGVGLASGTLSGMFGIGGAVLTTPGLRALGAVPIEAVGSTVPPILPGALSGTWRYSRAGLVNWRVGITCGLAGTAFAVGGAWIADLVDGHVLMLATAAVLAVTAVATLRAALRHQVDVVDPEGPDAEMALPEEVLDGGRPGGGGDAAGVTTAERARAALEAAEADAVTRRYSVPTLAVVGAAAGLLAGVLGLGGGVILMPTFTSVVRIPLKVAVASSLVAVAIFSVPALVTHTLLGHVNWTYSLLLVAGTVPGAQIGSRITLWASDSTVRALFGAFLAVLAVVYGVSEILALS